MSFFAEIDKSWNTIPNYNALLEHFGAEGLRRVRLPMRWLSSIDAITVDAEARETDSEQRRINEMLSKFPADLAQGKLLDGYHCILSERNKSKRLSIRSVRLSLTPSVALLRLAADEGTDVPTQQQLNTLLIQTPGQRASISGFISYLCEHHEASLSLPATDPKRAKLNRRKKLENEIAELVLTLESDKNNLQRWIELALNYFHDIPRKTGRTLARSDALVYAEDGYWIHNDGKRYYIPTRSADISSYKETHNNKTIDLT